MGRLTANARLNDPGIETKLSRLCNDKYLLNYLIKRSLFIQSVSEYKKDNPSLNSAKDSKEERAKGRSRTEREGRL